MLLPSCRPAPPGRRKQRSAPADGVKLREETDNAPIVTRASALDEVELRDQTRTVHGSRGIAAAVWQCLR